MLKKTYITSAYTGLQQCSSCCSSPPPSCLSSTSPPGLPTQQCRPQPRSVNKRRRLTEPSSWISRRSYATVRDGSHVDFRDNMNWPCRNGQKANTTGSNPFVPSPYEIFNMSRREIYGKHTKLKYYELVKIYHPDRNGAGCETLSHIERLERYRLIVLAHEIISDPNKRQAFDAYGAGWANKQTNPARHTRGYSTASGMQYGQAPGYDASPFGNATWEDWERWYRDHANQGQRQAYTGTYINPNAFAVFVITAAVLSGILQATSITQQAGTYADKSLAFTEETTRFMTARASQFDDNNLDKNDRVRHFLERRDPTRYGLKEEEESQYRKHFSKHEEVLPPIGRPGSVIGDIKRAEQEGQNTPAD